MKKMQARTYIIALFLGQFAAVFGQKTALPPADVEMRVFIQKLMKRMTLDEKIGQLNLLSIGVDVVTGPVLSQDVEQKIRAGLVGGVFNTNTPAAVRQLQDMAVKQTRLGIPLLFGMDVIHGYRTAFPQPIGLACSWDMDLIRRTARTAAEEATADGLNWVFSPMTDICRDPRWGRIAEGAGEDPFLGAAIARAMVAGYQGDDLSRNNTLMACVKHFAMYGAAEAGRDYNLADMSVQRMFNYYLPPYHAAVEAGVGSVMASFNEINGTPAHAHRWLLTDILRKKWGFRGFVVADYTGIPEMIRHGIGDEVAVAQRAFTAGVTMDMVGELYVTHLKNLLKQRKITQQQIDDACRSILEAKWRLGLFADPYRYIDDSRPATQHLTPENRQLSLEAARKSIVLLKNEGNTLPLDPAQRIAFISPQLDRTRDLTGNWACMTRHQEAISIRRGIEMLLPNHPFLFAKGCNLIDNRALFDRLGGHFAEHEIDPRPPQELLDEALDVARRADVVVAILGEVFNMTGEASSMSNISLQPQQTELLRALKKLGKPLVLVLLNGRPMTLEAEVALSDAVVEAWFPGTMGGQAIAEVLFGRVNPSGKLCATFPRNMGQIPIYYNHFTTGRPASPDDWMTSQYLDVPNSPLFAFGHGLSYTTFEYTNMQLSAQKDKVVARIDVKNTGSRDGAEVVQMYLCDLVGSQTRPVQELKGFQRIELKSGETRTVSFDITEPMLRFFDNDLNWKSEDGEFEVMIGTSSDRVQRARFWLKNNGFKKN